MRLALLFVLLSASLRAQDLYEIVYSIQCPTAWQDSVMALNNDPPMILYCSVPQSLVKTNDPFPAEILTRIQDQSAWYRRTIRNNYSVFRGANSDSAIVANTLQFKGKPKKSEPILGYATMRSEGQAIGLSTKKVEVHYTVDLPGTHPWCSDLRGIPLRFIIPTDLGNYVVEATTITKKELSDLPDTPRGSEESETGLEMKENFFIEEDSSFVYVYGLITDYTNGNVLGLMDIVVYEKNQVIFSTRSDFHGVFQFRLKYGGQYTLEFGSAPYVHKKVLVDLLTYRPSSPILYLEMMGDLFTNPKAVDCTVFQTPVLKLYYDMNTKDMAFDENYNSQRAMLVNEVLQKIK